MKIVIAVHHFPPHYTGGAEWRAYRTAAELRDRGYEVHVICVEAIDSGDGDGLIFEDDIYDDLSVRRMSFNLETAPDPFRWTYDNPWIGEHMREYLAGLAPDVLHLIGGYLMSGSTIHAAYNLGVPTVVTLTDFWFLCPRITRLRSDGQLCASSCDAITCARCLGEQKRRYRIPGTMAPGLMDAFWRWQARRIAQVQARMNFLWDTLNRVDVIISPSQFLRKFFVRTGLAPERIVFSRQGHDFPDMVPRDLEKPASAHLRVGYLGQIAPHKGVHTLFEAVRQLPSVGLEVKVYGDVKPFPDYARRLCQMARRDSRLSLMGVYDQTEVSQVLHGLDVIVVPSVWYENSPNAILEAFAHQVPVIASNLGGMGELVCDGENGFLFVPGDADDLARQLRRLLDDPNVLPTLRAGIGPVKSVKQEMGELEENYRLALNRADPKLGHGASRGSRAKVGRKDAAMRVVLATHHFPPRYTGGVELITLRLAKWLVRNGAEVEVVCVESIFGKGRDGVSDRSSVFEGIKVHRLAADLPQTLSSFEESYDNPVIGQWFERYLRVRKPDLIHIHSGYLLSSSTITAAQQTGVPMVVSLHDYWFLCPQIKLVRPDGRRCDGNRSPSECAWCLLMRMRRYRWSDRLTQGLAGTAERWLANRRWLANCTWGRLSRACQERQQLLLERLCVADQVLTQSPFLRERVIASGLPPDKIQLVPYGLDLSRWTTPVTPGTTDDDVLRIGYLGQIAPPKGVHLLVEAVGRLKALDRRPHLTVYGDADSHPGYGRRLRSLAGRDSRVTFAGRYENRCLAEILADLDVVVVPSCWCEIGPLVTLEAFAAKTPVVATDLPNMNAQIQHGVNGLLFEPGNVCDLSRQLQRLIDEPELLGCLQSGIDPVRTHEQEASEIYSIYCQVLKHTN